MSSAGWAVTTAIAVYVFDRAGAPGAAVIALGRLVPAAAAAPVAGAALERFGRVRVVATSCLAQAGCLAAAGGLVITSGSLAALFVVMAMIGAVTSAARPGLQALLADLSRDEAERADATTVWAALDSTGFLLGAGIAGAAMALIGAAAVCAGAAVTTTVSAALVLAIRSPTTAIQHDDGGVALRPLDGLRTVLGTSTLHAPLLLLTGLMLLEGTTDVQLVAVSNGLHLGDGGPGLMFFLWGIGGCMSSLLVRRLVRRCGYGPPMALGAIGFGLALGLAGASGAAVTLVAMPLAGIGFGLVEIGVMGTIPQRCNTEALARVYGVSEVIYGGAVAVGVVLAPVLIATLGAARSVTVIGIAFTLVTMLGCGICARPARGHRSTASRRTGYGRRMRASSAAPAPITPPARPGEPPPEELPDGPEPSIVPDYPPPEEEPQPAVIPDQPHEPLPAEDPLPVEPEPAPEPNPEPAQPPGEDPVPA